MWIRILSLILLCGLSVACGKVSRPIPPEGSTYPRTYVVTQEAE